MRIIRFCKRIFVILLILTVYLLKTIFDKLPKIVYLIENQNINHQINDDYSVKKFVVISSTVELYKDYYMFYLPLVALSWRRINYEPVILIASSKSLNQTNKLAQIVIKYLNLLNVSLVHVPSKSNYEVITSMVCRILCGLIPDNLINNNDFIITSDSDLFPISKSYYKVNLKSDSIKIWDAGSCDDFEYNIKKYEMFAMAHIGMKKHQWREVMNLKSSSSKINSKEIFKIVKNLYGESYIKTNSEIKRGQQTKYPLWFLDQMTISIKIHNYTSKISKSNLTKLKFKGTRLNRGTFFNANWFSQLNYLTDFHAFHSDIFSKWRIMIFFLQQMFDLNYVKLFDQYYKEYMNERNKMSIQNNI